MNVNNVAEGWGGLVTGDKDPKEDLAEMARLQFQGSRNALFLARLLAEIQGRRDNSAELNEIVTAVERANGFDKPVPLVNQTTFLQMAYMTLVYPREGAVGEVMDSWMPSCNWMRVNVLKDEPGRFGQTSASEQPPNWAQLLRTVRNALAHSAVEIHEDSFVFTDTYKGKTVEVAFDWAFLGELTTEFFWAANTALYERFPNAEENL